MLRDGLDDPLDCNQCKNEWKKLIYGYHELLLWMEWPRSRLAIPVFVCIWWYAKFCTYIQLSDPLAGMAAFCVIIGEPRMRG